MPRRLPAVLLVLLVPPLVRAQEGPERLLPPNSQVFIRWDGLDRHQAAFDKTAMSRLVQGEVGEAISNLLTDKKQYHLLRLGRALGNHGLLVGIEIRSVQPPDAQLVAVLPNAKTQWDALFGALNWAIAKDRMEVKETEVSGRTVYQVQGTEPVHVAFWKEGKEAVLIAGIDSPADLIKRWEGKGPRITDNVLYKKVTAFKEFTPALRGYVDVAACAKIGKQAGGDPAEKVIAELGVDGFKDLTFYHGFEGEATRTLVAWEVPGPRKGLAKLVSGKPFSLDELPVLPSNLTGFTAMRFDALAFYDGVVELLEKLLPPEQGKMVRPNIIKANLALGVNIRDDILANLGSLVVSYTAPGDGPLLLGQTLLIQVKDASKLQAALDKAVQNLGKLTHRQLTPEGPKEMPLPVELKQRTYRGAKLSQVYVRQPGMFLVPSYAIHKDWLAIGLAPQPVQGYILRTANQLPVWKPTSTIKASLDKLPAKVTSVSVEDPRVGVRFLLGLAPFVAGGVVNSMPDAKTFDVSVLPYANDVAYYLFPNVSVTVDDGKVWRYQSINSLPVPGLALLDEKALVIMAAITSLGRSAEHTFQKVGDKIKE
jgi:hypothetical protein